MYIVTFFLFGNEVSRTCMITNNESVTSFFETLLIIIGYLIFYRDPVEGSDVTKFLAFPVSV